MFNTLEVQRQLVVRGLAVEKKHKTLPLSLFKYSRKVMYDYLWFQIPELMECRGHVYDTETGQLVVAAPRKSFNYLENGWWKDVPLDTIVRAEIKYNGYLACSSVYRDERIVTTTGSFDSEYVSFAEKQNIIAFIDCTATYEVCDQNFDPHIVHESNGVKLLSFRSPISGWNFPSQTQTCNIMTLGDALEFVKNFRGEGLMLYRYDSDETNTDVCKLKSPYYVGKKMLMRKRLNVAEKNLPEIWRNMPEIIRSYYIEQTWDEVIDEQDRRVFIEQLQHLIGL